MEKTRDAFRAWLRSARGPVLAALDIEINKAVDTGGDEKALRARRQALRDITKDSRIEQAPDRATLLSLWPADFPSLAKGAELPDGNAPEVPLGPHLEFDCSGKRKDG